MDRVFGLFLVLILIYHSILSPTFQFYLFIYLFLFLFLFHFILFLIYFLFISYFILSCQLCLLLKIKPVQCRAHICVNL